MTIIKKAIQEWKKILGENNIVLENDKLSLYRESSLGKVVDVPCVLLPHLTADLAKCLKVANEFNIPVFTISTGKNHGYNSSSPLKINTVVIDLRNLNKILDYNNEFGYVEVEPGVTFEQLYQFLAKNCCDYMMSGFGGSSKASIIGNALDRGVGKGRYGHREKAAEISQVLLSNGEVIDLVDKYNYEDKTIKFKDATVGLNFSPLFYQSNLAVVTKMIVYLEPIPEYLSIVSFSFNDDNKIQAIINSLKKLNKLRVIEPVYSLYNDVRLVVGSGLAKKTKNENIDVIVKEGIQELSKRYGRQLSRWNSAFSIHCSCKEDAELRSELIKKELGDICDFLTFYGVEKKQAKTLIKKSINDKKFVIDESEFKFLFNLGFTNNYDQQTMYWDNPIQFNEESNPINDGCGLIFFAPKIPFSAKEIDKALKLAKNIAEKNSIELPITFQFKTEEIAYLVVPIVFNRNNKHSTDVAYAYYEELFMNFSENGFIPYRWPSISIEKLFNKNSNFFIMATKIKKIFDDKLILNQNRYLHHNDDR